MSLRKVALGLLGFCLCLGQTGAAAAPDPVKALYAAYDGCMHLAQSNPDFGDCGGKVVDGLELLLNKTWAATYAVTPPTAKAKLLDEQRAWIKYKDKSCQIWQEQFGREGELIDAPRCRALIIGDRISKLQAIGERIENLGLSLKKLERPSCSWDLAGC